LVVSLAGDHERTYRAADDLGCLAQELDQCIAFLFRDREDPDAGKFSADGRSQPSPIR